MYKYLLLLLCLTLITSCRSPKSFQYDGRKVTKKVYNRKLNRYTKQFVKRLPEEDKIILSNLEVVYDTIKKKQ